VLTPCNHQVGEPTELYFSLYSARSGQNLTEEFKVGLTANGLPPDINAIGTMKSWFEVRTLLRPRSSIKALLWGAPLY
jgi:hypothetical protein